MALVLLMADFGYDGLAPLGVYASREAAEAAAAVYLADHPSAEFAYRELVVDAPASLS